MSLGIQAVAHHAHVQVGKHNSCILAVFISAMGSENMPEQ